MPGESGGDEGGADGPVAELLTVDRRRLALQVLQAFDEPITLADLAEEVAIRERDAPITDVSGETVAAIYHSLYHTHVPRLADADIVEYDQDRDMVHVADDVDLDLQGSAPSDREHD